MCSQPKGPASGGSYCLETFARATLFYGFEVHRSRLGNLPVALPFRCDDGASLAVRVVFVERALRVSPACFPGRSNPLRGRAAIRFSPASGSSTQVLIHDAAGRRAPTGPD